MEGERAMQWNASRHLPVPAEFRTAPSVASALGLAIAIAGGLGACGGKPSEPALVPYSAESSGRSVASVMSTDASESSAPASASAPPAEATPARKANVANLIAQTMKGIVDAFNAHDAKKVASFYAAESVVSSYGAPEGRGPDAIAHAIDRYVFATFPDAKEAPLRAWVRDNVAVVEMAWTGTMTGDALGMKATRRSVGQIRANVLAFNDDGLVNEQHEYRDDAGLMAQMIGRKGAPAVPILPDPMPSIHVAKGTPDEDDLVDLAKANDETLSRDDAKAAEASIAEDGDYWTNISGGPAIRGAKDMAKSIDAFFKAFPDQKWSTVAAWGIDGFAIVEHTMTGTQKGPLGLLRASKNQVKAWHWLDILQPAADGKIQHGWGYANLVEMAQQTGALRQSGARPPTKM